MNFRNFRITLESDGFRITARGDGIVPGTPFLAEYEVAGGWRVQELYFDPEPPSLFHPFRQSMFVYTGEPPLRVMVRGRNLPGGDSRWTGRTRFSEVRRLHSEGHFECAPNFEDALWETGVPPSWGQPSRDAESQAEADGSWDVPPPLPAEALREREEQGGREAVGESRDGVRNDGPDHGQGREGAAGVEPNAY
jgi:hypothetical protein